MKKLFWDNWRRIAWAAGLLPTSFSIALWLTWQGEIINNQHYTYGEISMRVFFIPAVLAVTAFLVSAPKTLQAAPLANATPSTANPGQPYLAQVVGLQWLNPLQRRDYPTEWQLLWCLGVAKPNINDSMVQERPEKYKTLQAVSPIANGNEGTETFIGYHKKYISKVVNRFRDIYFSDSSYFYNAHSLEDKSTWRELAGIHVEYAVPPNLDPIHAAIFTKDTIINNFDIGSTSFPKAWSRSTPPDVHITTGGANAGFTSLAAGLDYLQSHPNETVWVMNWDAPSRPKDTQINENMVLLFLAGPNFKTNRAPLAWLGYPASTSTADFALKSELPAPAIQAWKASLTKASENAGKTPMDIGYVIHDANISQADSSDRLGRLAQTLTESLPGFDFLKSSFNTPALLGEMGTGTALTNVALAIAYANHMGKNVLVAGTSDAGHPTALIVVPPAIVRPIIADQPWFRARGGNHVYLPWWGIRFDATYHQQGFSE